MRISSKYTTKSSIDGVSNILYWNKAFSVEITKYFQSFSATATYKYASHKLILEKYLLSDTTESISSNLDRGYFST